MCSFSLFDPSSHQPKKVTKKAPPTPEAKALEREKLLKIPEVKDWVEKIEKMRKELDEKTLLLIEKGGHTPLSIKRYLNDPKNFSSNDWQKIQKQREALDVALGLELNPSFKKLKRAKESKTLSKERKGKTLGSRKKWLDMR